MQIAVCEDDCDGSVRLEHHQHDDSTNTPYRTENIRTTNQLPKFASVWMRMLRTHVRGREIQDRQ